MNYLEKCACDLEKGMNGLRKKAWPHPAAVLHRVNPGMPHLQQVEEDGEGQSRVAGPVVGAAATLCCGARWLTPVQG